ncbi:MAG: MauE/DoxX family redox-associated membrane protein [Planctomycetota bacterium]
MYDIVRLVLASVLLIAAGLKGYQLATEPALNTSILDAPWFLIAVVEFELVFGLCLLTNIWPEWTRRAAIVRFAVFAAVSLYKALSGAASCGCFGRFQVNPWYTFVVDALAAAALLGCPSATGQSRVARDLRLLGSQVAGVAAIWFLIGVPAAVAVGSYIGTTLSDAGEVIGNGKIVVLKPEAWVGKEFPLLNYIGEDVPDTLASGAVPLPEELGHAEWRVLLYRHDCPDCQEAVERCRQIARDMMEVGGTARPALIEVSPYGDRVGKPPSFDDSHVSARLSDVKGCLVGLPVEITVQQGVVAAVKDGISVIVTHPPTLGLAPVIGLDYVRRRDFTMRRAWRGIVERPSSSGPWVAFCNKPRSLAFPGKFVFAFRPLFPFP